MISQPLFIPLYLDEDDRDLWLTLQSVAPESRSLFIKETLRQSLLGGGPPEPSLRSLGSEDRTAVSSEHTPDPGAEAQDEAQDEVQGEERPSSQEVPGESFSLADLFTETTPPGILENPESKTVQGELPALSGFKYVMQHIIGTEDDEAVLKILNGKSKGE